jgi:hypothetical protein
MVKCCGFVEFRHELGKKTQKSGNLQKSTKYRVFIIWRFPFPDVVRYVQIIILIVNSRGLQCSSSMDDILPFSLPSENLENNFLKKTLFLCFESAKLKL